MRSLRNDKHGYLLVASRAAEHVKSNLLFTICTQPRCEARPEPGPTMQLPTMTPHFGRSWRGVPRLLTTFDHRQLAFDLPLHQASDLHDAQSLSRSVLPSCMAFHALRPCNMHTIQGTAVLDDAQDKREFKPSAHLADCCVNYAQIQ
jgi:hypothetical protein